MRRWPTVFLIVLGFIVVVEPAGARITRTRPSPTKTWSPLIPITIGSVFEYESNDEARTYDFPALFEYSFSEKFRLTVEPNYGKIDSKDETVLASAGGLGDLET